MKQQPFDLASFVMIGNLLTTLTEKGVLSVDEACNIVTLAKNSIPNEKELKNEECINEENPNETLLNHLDQIMTNIEAAVVPESYS